MCQALRRFINIIEKPCLESDISYYKNKPQIQLHIYCVIEIGPPSPIFAMSSIFFIFFACPAKISLKFWD